MTLVTIDTIKQRIYAFINLLITRHTTKIIMDPSILGRIGLIFSSLKSKNSLAKATCIIKFIPSAMTVVIAAPFIHIFGIKMKFSPILINAEMVVACRHFFSCRLTIRTQLVNSDEYIANIVAKDKIWSDKVPSRYCSPPAM